MMRLARMASMLAPMAAGGSGRFTAPSAQITGGRYPTTARATRLSFAWPRARGDRGDRPLRGGSTVTASSF
jgi:hypothetical protein